MYTLAKTFRFSAGHAADHLPQPDHPCRAVHGHNYEVEVVVRGAEPDAETGFLVDYHELNDLGRWLDAHFDHHFLNDVLGGGRATTVESLCKFLYDHCLQTYSWGPMVVCVKVSESPKSWGAYSPGAVLA